MANSSFLRECLYGCLATIIAIVHHTDEVARVLTEAIIFTSSVSIDGASQDVIASFVTSHELQA